MAIEEGMNYSHGSFILGKWAQKHQGVVHRNDKRCQPAQRLQPDRKIWALRCFQWVGRGLKDGTSS